MEKVVNPKIGEEFVCEYECDHCFVLFDALPSRMKDKPSRCLQCIKNPVKKNSLLLLKRRFANMQNTRVHRFPTIMQHLFQHVKLESEPE